MLIFLLRYTEGMKIRPYYSEDYEALIDLYRTSEEFEVDPETDSERMLARKIERDPESVLVLEQEGELLASVSIIEDGRIALLFRLVVKEEVVEQPGKLLQELVAYAEEILRERGYSEVHCMAPARWELGADVRRSLGFTPGNEYRWFWKEL